MSENYEKPEYKVVTCRAIDWEMQRHMNDDPDYEPYYLSYYPSPKYDRTHGTREGDVIAVMTFRLRWKAFP